MINGFKTGRILRLVAAVMSERFATCKDVARMNRLIKLMIKRYCNMYYVAF